MMDHYEELGLERTASPEEIRQAYKRLVRLLHPDHCSDEPVRQLADLQMKRLNGLLAVLTNPAERASYDRTLVRGPTAWQFPRLPAAGRVVGPLKWYWTAAGAAAVLCILFLLIHPGPQASPARQFEPAPAATDTPSNVRRPAAQRLRTRASTVRGRPAETRSASEPSSDLQPGNGSGPEIATSPTDSPAGHPAGAPLLQIKPVPSAGDARAHSPLSGEWLFAPPAHSKSGGLYPPEYIELRVTEESGILHGRYRARYRIADQAISPTVSFQFAGPAEADGASLPWIGVGGAKGEVSLRLINDGALEVTWVATQMGAELGLISGTATLVRRLD